jgi:hypothetical protein
MTHDKGQRWTLVNAVINPQLRKTREYLLDTYRTTYCLQIRITEIGFYEYIVCHSSHYKY